MMEKVQKFGGAMFTPALLFAFSGIVVGLCTLFQSTVIMGSIAATGTMWYNFWYVIKEGAWTVFRQIPLLFVVALPVGLSKKQSARCSMEALVLYITFNYFLSAILSLWGGAFGVDFTKAAASGTGLTTIASIKTLDTGMIGALVVSGVVVYLHDKYFDTELPEWLGIFKGSSFICIIGFFAMLVLALIFAIVWPPIQHGISSMQAFITSSGVFGVFVYSLLERLLIPTGLHHFVYMPFLYDSAVVNGGIKAAWLKQLPAMASSSAPLKQLFPIGGYSLIGMTKVFSSIGIAGAFYSTAKKEKKKIVLALVIPAMLTAILAGVTEPIEFTFLFAAPFLFMIHAVLAALLNVVTYSFGIVGDFSSGLINWCALNWIPLGPKHWQTYLLQVFIGLTFSGIWFVVFRTLILKFNLKTPGREDESDDVKLLSKKEYKEKQAVSGESKYAVLAKSFLAELGGKDNIESVTNCATRLRVSVKDPALVASAEEFKRSGAHGLVAKGKAFQVIVGLSVQQVRGEFEKLL